MILFKEQNEFTVCIIEDNPEKVNLGVSNDNVRMRYVPRSSVEISEM